VFFGSSQKLVEVTRGLNIENFRKLNDLFLKRVCKGRRCIVIRANATATQKSRQLCKCKLDLQSADTLFEYIVVKSLYARFI